MSTYGAAAGAEPSRGSPPTRGDAIDPCVRRTAARPAQAAATALRIRLGLNGLVR